jgi:hypothetical protein
MSVRERFLAAGVLGLLLLAGVGLMVSQFIISPLRERSRMIGDLKDKIVDKNIRVAEILAAKAKLELWRKQSLPADVGLARLEYEKFLRELFRLSGFEGSSFSVTPGKLDARTGATGPGKKEQPFTPQTFAVEANGEEADLVEFLERFYRTPLLHQIKSMNISRDINPQANLGGPPGLRTPQASKNQLKVKMNIEALVLHDADKRNELLPGVDRQLAAADVLGTLLSAPSGFALFPWAVGPTGPGGPGILAVPSREYASIAGKDIFYGPQIAPQQAMDNFDSLEHVFLTDITYGTRWEAFLYARNNNTKTRLRASAGFDTFRVRDSKGETLVQGKVIRMEDRDVIFSSGDKYYSIHVGQNLDEAMRHPLDASRLKELGLTASASNGSGK